MSQRRIASNASFVARATRRPAPRTPNPHFQRQSPRFQSTTSSSSSSQASGSHLGTAAIGGLAGGLTTFTVGYIWYRRSGAREFLTATKTAKDYASSATQKLKEATPEPNEALQWLRNAATSYAAFIPGASGYVNSAFDDLDAIRAKHGKEVDEIVSNAYSELRDIAQNGQLSLLTAQKAWDVILKYMGQIGDLAGDASQQILDNHPALKDKVGGNLDKLKEMGANYGPEAKKEVDRTWEQIADVVKTGLSAENVSKVQKIVQEKVDKMKALGDEAWKKGMEQAQPYLDKNPKVKSLIEDNADALKSGNVQELYNKIKTAVEKGDTGDLESYVKKFSDKAKESGFGGMDQYLGKIPGGDQIIPKFQQLQEVAEKHGEEAQKLFKDAVSEISEVLKKKGSEAEELAKKAKEESKK